MHPRYVNGPHREVNRSDTEAGFPIDAAGFRRYGKALMRATLRISLFACLILVGAGCMAVHQRRNIRESVAPEPMTPRAWGAAAGTYIGPIRSTSRRFGSEGVSVAETRLEISGTADEPLIFMKMRVAFTSAGNMNGERTETFTNIDQRRYGVRGRLFASSHAPDQLLLQLKPQPLSPTAGSFMILTFRGHGHADVDFVEHAFRHGEGTLLRPPALEETAAD